jgi:hypothetical protein
MTTVSITVVVRGAGGPETTLNVDPAVVIGSWDDVFLPLLASSLGLGGPDDIASVVVRDSDGEEDLVDGTRARRSARTVASFGGSSRLIVEVGQRHKLWLDPSLEHDKHGQDMR